MAAWDGMRFGWLAALALVLSGCSEAGDPRSAEGPAMDGAGETTDAGRTGRAASVAVNGSSPLPDPIEVAWEGALDIQACAPSGPNSCMGASVPVSGKDDSLFLDSVPAFWTGSLTLAWNAASPATETLQFQLGFYEKCGATCWQGVGGSAMAVGSSPLVLDVQSLEAPAGSQGLWLSVHEERLTPDPVYAIASAGQEFRAEGRLQPTPPA